MAEKQSYESANIGALFDFGFNKFITLSIIKGVYALGLIAIGLTWLVLVVSGFNQGALPGIGVLVIGTVVALLYAIFLRISLELIVVIFRIGENTSRLAGREQDGADTGGHGDPGDPGRF